MLTRKVLNPEGLLRIGVADMNTSSHLSPLCGLLGKPAPTATNCFRVNGSGVVHAGLEIQLNHPMTGHTPALIVGERFICRDSISGFHWQPQDQGLGLVTRAGVKKNTTSKGGVVFTLTGQPDCNYLLACVDITLPHVTSKIRFWEGLVCDDGTDLVVRSGREFLLRLSGENSWFAVCYPDGRVCKFGWISDELQRIEIPPEEAAEIRIGEALKLAKEAKTRPEEQAKKAVAFAFHQIVQVMQFGGRISDSVFERGFGLLCEMARAHALPAAVIGHTFAVLRAEHAEAVAEFERAVRGDHAVMRFSNVEDKHQPSRRQLAKKAERREKDRERTLATRGGGGGGHSHKKSGKREGKKK